jgi:hypothetical protein
MRLGARVAIAILAASLSGCIYGVRQENAALRAARPPVPPAALAAYQPSQNDFPTVGGDILRGTSPADLAAARAEVARPLTPDPGGP